MRHRHRDQSPDTPDPLDERRRCSLQTTVFRLELRILQPLPRDVFISHGTVLGRPLTGESRGIATIDPPAGGEFMIRPDAAATDDWRLLANDALERQGASSLP